MKKQRKIWLSYDKSEVGAITVWLEEKAVQGWQFIRTDSYRMSFEKSATETLRYLIAPHTAEKSCLSLGWQQIDVLSKQFDIYATENSEVEKPNLNACVLGVALYHGVVKHTYIGIPCFILAVLSVARLGIYVFTVCGFVSAVVKLGSLILLLLVFTSISGFVCGFRHIRQAKIQSEHLTELATPRRNPMLCWYPKRSTALIFLLVFCSIVSVWQENNVTIERIPANRYIRSITLPILPPYTEKTLPLLEKICPKEWAAIEWAEANSDRNYCL